MNNWREITLSDWSGKLPKMPIHDVQSTPEYLREISSLRGEDLALLAYGNSALVAFRVGRRLRGLIHTAYAPGGILLNSPDMRPDEMVTMLEDLQREAGARGWLPILRFPPLMNMQIPVLATIAEQHGFRRRGSSTSYTFVLDLDVASDADLLASFKGSWRRNLKVAQKKNLEVTVRNEDADWELMDGLLQRIERRKGFSVPLGADFFSRMTASRKKGRLQLISVPSNDPDEPAAMIVLSTHGNSGTYLLGYSSEQKGDFTGAPALVQWEAMRLLRERKCSFYDLGGIDWVANPGVYSFKKSMGGVPATSSPLLVGVGSGFVQRSISQAWRLSGIRG